MGRAWTVYLDDDLIEEVKKTARRKKIPMSHLVKEALRRFLEEEKRREARKKLLTRLRSEKISEEESEVILRAWEDYVKTERRRERTFVEVFADESGA